MWRFLVPLSLFVLTLWAASCSPNVLVEPPVADEDGLGAGGGLVDSGTIHNVVDVPVDTGADIDPDKLKSHQTCAQVLQCVGELCKVSPGASCDAPCVQDASLSSAFAYAAYGSCRNDYCVAKVCAKSVDPTCVDTCLLQRCGPLLFRCNLEGQHASQPCSKMVACHKTCGDAAKARKKRGEPSGEYACLNDCYGELGVQAQALYDKWAICFATTLAKDRYAACLPELLFCGADGQGGGEPQTCPQIASCNAACAQQTGKAQDYQSCIGGCFSSGGVTAKVGWVAYLRCLSDLKEGEVDSSKCAATLVSCAGADGVFSCQEVRSCAEKCVLAGGQACHLSCMAQASDAGAVQYGALRWCYLAHCEAKCGAQVSCQESCLKAECASESQACAG